MRKTHKIIMGQYWRICDLSSMRQIDNGGGAKLGEFFLNAHISLDKLLEGDLFSGRQYCALHLPLPMDSKQTYVYFDSNC